MADSNQERKETNNSNHKKSAARKKRNEKFKNKNNVNKGTEGQEQKDKVGTKQKEEKLNQNKSNSKKQYNKNNKLPEMNFDLYISKEECSEGLKRGGLIKGALRINPRNFVDAFISSADGTERDIYIEGIADRNRSLPGDIVAVKLLPKEQWKTNRPGEPEQKAAASNENPPVFTKTGKVVFIIEKKHSRVACGFLKPFRNNSFGFALLSPVDNRIPRLMIPLTECPNDFKVQFKNYEKTLFIGSIADWGKNSAFASGKIMRSLGEAGHIEPETESILLCNDIDSSPFSEKVLRCLPDGKKWSVTKEELEKRKDMREECIFTIDPATARDLDDALSCKLIEEDVYEVGVHIADVSHFVEQGTELDNVASQRATSVYLAQKVVPMLPNVLCEQLCSLNPGVERLAYSVIWKMKSDGTILSEWFGRTVIRSCIKLSYDHAQRMIDSDETNDISPEEFPEIYGQFPFAVIASKVKLLYGISKFLRSRRFENGALRLDQPKLAFTLDGKTGMPSGCYVYQYKDSNRMIEEFMLLANMAVGHKIYQNNPDKAILRCHAPPQEILMEGVADTCKKFGIPFNIKNSSGISSSLGEILNRKEDIFNKESLFAALTLLCTKPFQNARYFCTGTIDDEASYRHYALNVPIYTHFTSPIRRYPDVLVHRLLTASLDKSFELRGNAEELEVVASHCNDKKWAAKKCSEQSSLLFFAVYLLECGPLTEQGVIVAVFDKAVDILCTRVGITVRAYMDKLPLWKHEFSMEDTKPTLILNWQNGESSSSAEGGGEDNLNKELKELTTQLEKKWQIKKELNEQPDKLPDDAVKQVLTVFATVSVVLHVDRQLPTKIIGTLSHPITTESVPSLQL